MSCSKRISETASDPSYIYQIFTCVIENTRYIDRIRFFKQVKDEIDRIIREKQSPEIIALVGDWGQGKSTFLDIIEEYGRNNNLSVTRIPFTK
ncbi:MAG: P-loop NTPase fold protein, partial [Saccharolobus sp.]